MVLAGDDVWCDSGERDVIGWRDESIAIRDDGIWGRRVGGLREDGGAVVRAEVAIGGRHRPIVDVDVAGVVHVAGVGDRGAGEVAGSRLWGRIVAWTGTSAGWFGLGKGAQVKLVDGGGFWRIVSCRDVAVASGECSTIAIAQSGVWDIIVELVFEDLGRDGLRDLYIFPGLFVFVVGIPRRGTSCAILSRLNARQSSDGKDERGNAEDTKAGQHLNGGWAVDRSTTVV